MGIQKAKFKLIIFTIVSFCLFSAKISFSAENKKQVTCPKHRIAPSIGEQDKKDLCDYTFQRLQDADKIIEMKRKVQTAVDKLPKDTAGQTGKFEDKKTVETSAAIGYQQIAQYAKWAKEELEGMKELNETAAKNLDERADQIESQDSQNGI